MVARRFDAPTRLRIRAARRDERGFSLVELLVVVIIIGILAAIAIPIYIGIQNGAKNAEVKSDLANAQLALVAASTDTGSSFVDPDGKTITGSTGAGVYAEYGMTVGSDVTLEVHWSSQTDFCVQGKNDSVNKNFSVDAGGGVKEGSCSTSSPYTAGN